MIYRKVNENYFSFKKWCKKEDFEDNKIQCEAVPSNVDEDQAKTSLLAEGAES